MPARVLVVEDDPAMLEVFRELLKKEGLHVVTAPSAERAMGELSLHPPDLVVLDRNLPGFSGIDLCRNLKGRPETAAVPVMFVTSRAMERDKVEGLDAGADDYLTKPFSNAEFLARVRALLRRASRGGRAADVLRAGPLEADLDTRTVRVGGQEVELRRMEFELLALLLRKKGRVLTRAFLAEAVWGPEAAATSHTINVCVAGLRKKLGKAGRAITAVVGVGYKLRDE